MMEDDMDREEERLDRVRESVLDRMENGDRLMRFGLGAAALLELAMVAVCILLVDWSDRDHVLLFVIFLLSYFIFVLGMLALAGHVTRATGRILAVLEARDR
jgi:hypothetical protein